MSDDELEALKDQHKAEIGQLQANYSSTIKNIKTRLTDLMEGAANAIDNHADNEAVVELLREQISRIETVLGTL